MCRTFDSIARWPSFMHMHVSVYLEAESPCQFPVFQTTHFGALVRLLFHELLGLQLRRLLRWSSIGAREGFYLLCSLLLEPCARHASRALRRACGQGAVLSLCMVRLGSGRFGVGFWVGFWVGLRARDFPTERVLSRTPLIIRTVDQSEGKPQKRISINKQKTTPNRKNQFRSSKFSGFRRYGPRPSSIFTSQRRTRQRTPPLYRAAHSARAWP